MEKQKVYFVVVVERGKEGKGDKDDIPDRLVTPEPVLVLAKDEQSAAIATALKLTDVDASRVEVLVRPF